MSSEFVEVELLGGEKVKMALDTARTIVSHMRIAQYLIVGLAETHPLAPRSATLYIFHEVNGVYRYLLDLLLSDNSLGVVLGDLHYQTGENGSGFEMRSLEHFVKTTSGSHRRQRAGYFEFIAKVGGVAPNDDTTQDP